MLDERFICKILFFSQLFIVVINWGAQAQWPIPQDAFGVWDKREGYLYSTEPVPSHVKGMGIHLNLADLQPDPNDPDYFDWSHYSDAIAWCAEREINVYLKVYPVNGNQDQERAASFPLFFDLTDSETFVETFQFNDGKWYPDYKSSNYKKHYRNMVLAFGDFFFSLPENERAWVSHVYVQTGAHGDPGPYNQFKDGEDNLDPEYQFTVEEWFDWQLNDFFPARQEAFQGRENARKIGLAFNGSNPLQNDTRPKYEWIDANIVNYGLKPSDRNARGTHLHNERNSINWYNPRSIDPTGKIIFSFNELGGTTDTPIAQENQPMFVFWSMINALQTGISIVDASNGNISVPDYIPHFEFFNKYAPQIFSAEATDAYIFFHRGLDLKDLDSFPEEIYGDENDPNLRFAKMWNDYGKALGAREPEKDLKDLKHNKNEMNDFGVDIHRENYARFLTQFDPEGTSEPVYRVEAPGELLTGRSIYSRFGRRITAGTDKDRILLNFSEKFFPDGGHDISYDVKFNIRYYNKGKGEINFYYDGLSDNNEKATTITLDDKEEFKVETITIPDGRFNGRSKNDSDFNLVCTNGRAIITSIEVSRSLYLQIV